MKVIKYKYILYRTETVNLFMVHRFLLNQAMIFLYSAHTDKQYKQQFEYITIHKSLLPYHNILALRSNLDYMFKAINLLFQFIYTMLTSSQIQPLINVNERCNS